MDRKELKQLVLNTLSNQLAIIQNQITDLATDSLNDAKSSAGDKHETGLAMMHLEQEKLTAKLQQLQEMHQIARTLPTEKKVQKVTFGSVVKINQSILYISVPLQAVLYQNQKIFCVSEKAPLVQQLLHKEIGSEITFNTILYQILNIY
ncbi:hypothetical protein [Paenimyroides aestuarii]|uniref:Uncharacterized protein n=1 Tax=Paenimyroides aestuarii TaxID=2968490 RepID=A0ABY5NRY0_9FLAO|nr:hypothetical protein [Paenimyroides aestuarii]UUV21321.1 hypothetical protein NPX36_13475 [Paenimyroides aestuarii]